RRWPGRPILVEILSFPGSTPTRTSGLGASGEIEEAAKIGGLLVTAGIGLEELPHHRAYRRPLLQGPNAGLLEDPLIDRTGQFRHEISVARTRVDSGSHHLLTGALILAGLPGIDGINRCSTRNSWNVGRDR